MVAPKVLPRGAGSWSSGDGWSTSMGESSLWAAVDSDMDCASDCNQPNKEKQRQKHFSNISFWFPTQKRLQRLILSRRALIAAGTHRGRGGDASSAGGDERCRSRGPGGDCGRCCGCGGGGGGGQGTLLEAASPLTLSHHLDNGVGLRLQLPHCSLDAAG